MNEFARVLQIPKAT